MSHFPPEMCVEIGPTFPAAISTFWVKCPYDPSHKALNTRYHYHMEKCRRNYVDKARSVGEDLLYLSCKYNPQHQILAPEIIYHEYACEDKNNPVEYLFHATYDEVMEASLVPLSDSEGEIEDLKGRDIEIFGYKLDDIVDKVYKKFHDEAAMINTAGKVFWADPGICDKLGQSRITQSLSAEIPPSPDQSVICRRQQVRRRRDPTPHPRKGEFLDTILEKEEENELKEEGKDKDHEEECWTSGNTPTFSWLDYQHKFRPMSFQFPLGLSKSQKKQYAKVNADMLKYKHGIFPDNDGKEMEVLKIPENFSVSMKEEELYDDWILPKDDAVETE